MLRLLLLTVRMAVCPIAALLLVGLFTTGESGRGGRPPIILLDDTITAWMPDASGGRDIDDHLDRIDEIQSQYSDGKPLVVVPLSGQVVHDLRSDLRSQLHEVAHGPDWNSVRDRVRRFMASNPDSKIVAISGMRHDLVRSIDELTDLPVVEFDQPAQDERDTVWITGVRSSRAVSLPGDPLTSSQITVMLERGRPEAESSIQIQIDLLDSSGQPTGETATSKVHWPSGARRVTASIDVELELPESAIAHVHLPEFPSPAASWWISLEQRSHASVTMITDEPRSDFDPGLQSSWVQTAIEAGLQPNQLTVQHRSPTGVQIDTLDRPTPIVVVGPELLPASSWSALLDQPNSSPVIVLPRTSSDELSMQSFLVGSGSADVERILTRSGHIPIELPPVPSEGGPLAVLQGELPSLLEQLRIDRMLDLRPLLGLDGAKSLVMIDEHPLLVMLPRESGRSSIISALAWHPSWSDLPLRPAAPAILQELIRSGAHTGMPDPLTASATSGPEAGVLDGRITLPDITSEAQRPMDKSASDRLAELNWVQLDTSKTQIARSGLGPLMGLVLLMLLLLESVLTRCIDNRRSGFSAVRRPA
ncbi:MAG: hypothetical protein MK101_02340 [Phycisphaerales bacterium]|nr:hypothetical protein [Phycisphaerales bacterium]